MKTNIMELSDATIQTLKNFAQINSNIVIKQGNELSTISEARNLVARSTITEQFPTTFGIYDLNEFLGVLSLVSGPRLTFDETHVVVSDQSNRSKIKYFYSDPDHLTAPTRDIKMPETEVTFTLTNDVINSIKRAASTLGHSKISIKPNSGVISISVVDTDDATSNVYTIDVDGEYPDVPFEFVININNLRLISGDYDVEVSSKLISQFTHKQSETKYWIALEKNSSYGE
jgi:hypothetical protein